MVIKPIGQPGIASDVSSVGAVDATSAASATTQAASVAASSPASGKAAVQAAVERAAGEVRAGRIGFAEGVSRVISAMADHQLPATLDGALRESQLREMEQVLGDDPRVSASVERLLRAAVS